MIRKSVETRDWLNTIEPRNIRSVMKRVVEEITLIDQQVGTLYEDGLKKEQGSGEPRVTMWGVVDKYPPQFLSSYNTIKALISISACRDNVLHYIIMCFFMLELNCVCFSNREQSSHLLLPE